MKKKDNWGEKGGSLTEIGAKTEIPSMPVDRKERISVWGDLCKVCAVRQLKGEKLDGVAR